MSPDFYISNFGFLLLLSRSDSLSKVTRCFHWGFFAPFFVRPMLTKERSGRQICRPLYSVSFSWTVIRPVLTSGWVEKAQLISSSGRVLWIFPPITNPQFWMTFCRASSLLSATTSNTPSNIYCVRTLPAFLFFLFILCSSSASLLITLHDL